MKIRYEFSDKTVEIEVDDNWGNILIDLDRQEYNVNHKETRRHTSLDGLDFEGKLFADSIDIPHLLEQKETAQMVRAAVEQLKPKQRDLIYALYLSDKPVSQAEYGRQLGIAETSVQQNARRAKQALKEILKSPGKKV